jgi:hypothetical protein
MWAWEGLILTSDNQTVCLAAHNYHQQRYLRQNMNTEISPAQELTFPRIEETSSKPKKRDITAEEIRAIFHYDPETGWLVNAVTRNPLALAGTRAGSPHNRGYRRVSIDNKRHLEHRLVWLYVHGAAPTRFIDHINNVKDDNRIENLRDVTKSQNGANTGKRSNNTSGHKGVYWDKPTRKWKAQIGISNKVLALGYFSNIDDAIAARQAAELKYQGDFAYKGPNG